MKKLAEKLRIVNDFIDEATVPIRLVALARLLGIHAYKAPWPKRVSGLIQKDDEKGGESGFAIFVNQDHSETRQRFTLAHEIAHYVLHEDMIGDGIFDDALYRSGIRKGADEEANALAYNILMPWSHLNKYIAEYGIDIGRLANKFEVSKRAMSLRLDAPEEEDSGTDMRAFG